MSTSTSLRTAACGIAFAVFSSGALLSCSSDSSGVGPAPGSELLALPCTDPLDSVYQGQPPPADWGPEMRGEITQCTFERTISIDEMAEAFAVSDSFVNPGLSTPVYKYRIQYWSERNEGGFNKDNRPLVYTSAGDGWVAIMPDNPGLGPPGTTAWLSAGIWGALISPGFQKCGLDRLEAQGGDAPAPCEPLDEYDPTLECSIPIIPNSPPTTVGSSFGHPRSDPLSVGSFHEFYGSLPDLPRPVGRAARLHIEETDHEKASQIVWDSVVRSSGHGLWWRW